MNICFRELGVQQEMVDESTDAIPVSDEPDPDILRRYEEKLLMDEQLADLRQQVTERDQEIDELRRQLDHNSADYQKSLQMLTDAEQQVSLYTFRVCDNITNIHRTK